MSPPTDIELMMYFDGELEEPRRAEVERFVRGDATSATTKRQKLAGLGLVGEAVRADASSRGRESFFVGPSSIVDSVMGAIEKESAKSGKTASAKPAPKLVTEAEADRAVAQAERGSAKVVSIATKQASTTKQAPAANDNGKSIFALAGLAAAAAVALFVWGRSSDKDASSTTANNSTSTAITTEITAGDPPPVIERKDTVATQTPPASSGQINIPVVEDDSPGVEVAAVDFGSKSGAIYYMDGDQRGATTTVVWIADE